MVLMPENRFFHAVAGCYFSVCSSDAVRREEVQTNFRLQVKPEVVAGNTQQSCCLKGHRELRKVGLD